MRNRIALVAVAVAGLIGAGTMAAVSTASAATTGCSANYTVASQTGGSVSAGFIGSFSGSNPVPASFNLNGVACTGGTTGPTTPPSSEPTTGPTTGQIGAVAAQVPVHAGEIGQDTCAHDYIDQVMAWADANGVGYTAWTWNPWGCSGGNVLIESYDGTPTETFGAGYKAHLLTVDPYRS